MDVTERCMWELPPSRTHQGGYSRIRFWKRNDPPISNVQNHKTLRKRIVLSGCYAVIREVTPNRPEGAAVLSEPLYGSPCLMVTKL